MSFLETLITVGLVFLGTILTRFLSFVLFPSGKPTPPVVQYLGNALPAAVLGMLVVYCYKDISLTTGNHGLPELVSGLVVVVLQAWRKNLALSLLGGTGLYMLLLHIWG